MFTGLYQLSVLRLQRNTISFIEDDSFAMMNNLLELDLAHNNLKSLSVSIFGEIDPARVIGLILKHNPLQCDSRLCWIRDDKEPDWIHLQYPYETFCVDPDKVPLYSWSELTAEDLNCQISMYYMSMPRVSAAYTYIAQSSLTDYNFNRLCHMKYVKNLKHSMHLQIENRISKVGAF